MTGHKKNIPERKSLSSVKMGRGSLLCERLCVQQFKNNATQHKTVKNLGILSYMAHIIIKRYRESRGISVCKGLYMQD